MNGKIVTTKKEIDAKDFFTTKLKAYDMLDQDEIVTAVTVPELADYETGYIKDRLRPAIDFPLLSLAYAAKVKEGLVEDARAERMQIRTADQDSKRRQGAAVKELTLQVQRLTNKPITAKHQ